MLDNSLAYSELLNKMISQLQGYIITHKINERLYLKQEIEM